MLLDRCLGRCARVLDVPTLLTYWEIKVFIFSLSENGSFSTALKHVGFPHCKVNVPWCMPSLRCHPWLRAPLSQRWEGAVSPGFLFPATLSAVPALPENRLQVGHQWSVLCAYLLSFPAQLDWVGIPLSLIISSFVPCVPSFLSCRLSHAEFSWLSLPLHPSSPRGNAGGQVLSSSSLRGRWLPGCSLRGRGVPQSQPQAYLTCEAQPPPGPRPWAAGSPVTCPNSSAPHRRPGSLCAAVCFLPSPPVPLALHECRPFVSQWFARKQFDFLQ